MKNNKLVSWLNRNLIGFSLASFFNDVSYEMVTALLPTLFIQLTGSAAPLFVGIMTGFSEITASITKLISGIITDRSAIRKPFIMSGYGIGAVFNSLIAFVSSGWQIVLCQSISRVGKGLREPARDALLSTLTEPAYYGRAFGFNRAMDAVGAVVGPLIALIALPYIPLRSLIFFSILPGICAVVVIALLVQETTEKSSHNPTPLTIDIHQLPSFFVLFLIIMFIFGCGNFRPMLLILRAQESLHYPTTGLKVAGGIAIGFYIVFNIIEAISEYVLGRLSDIGGRRQLLALVGFGLFGISSLLIGYATSWWGILTAFIISGISVAAISALSRSYAAELLPETIRGFGYGSLQALEGIAKLIASFMVGILWTFVSPAAGFTYAAITSFIAMILLLLYRPPVKD